jgi:hypothetical protein
MKKINLTPEQIIDLIFEKIITYEEMQITMQENSMEILHLIEDRLIYGRKLSYEVA